MDWRSDRRSANRTRPAEKLPLVAVTMIGIAEKKAVGRRRRNWSSLR
jgi:hypothetical protein